jgi:hypothetical protein
MKQSIFSNTFHTGRILKLATNIDLMHVTKNVFDNIIGTLLDMLRKTKDGLKSCNDLKQFGLRA